jgi:hypothetical protein
MAEPKILHLTLKKKFYDMIASGEKKEEYRDIKPHWVARLVDELRSEQKETDFTFLHHGYLFSMQSAIGYDIVQFRNGYRKDSPTMQVEIKDITDGFSKPEWCDGEYKPCFVIKLGKILSTGGQ